MIRQRDFWIYLLLSIVTCGIYGIYFWYKYTEDVNTVCYGDGQETMNYILVVLLSLVTRGIFTFIWVYQLGNRLQANAPRYQLSFQENGTSALLWYIFGSLICGIGPYIAQYSLIKNMNALATAYNEYNSQPTEPTPAP